MRELAHMLTTHTRGTLNALVRVMLFVPAACTAQGNVYTSVLCCALCSLGCWQAEARVLISRHCGHC